MNILFTVCGRAGSKGVKNKNLKNLLGKPLVYYTLSAIDLFIKENKGVDTIHVCASSDSQDLLGLITSQKAFPVFTVDRSAELSGDTIGKIAVIRDALLRCNKHYSVEHDMVIDLDITSPIRRLQDIVNIYEMKKNSPDFDVVFSITSARRNPYFNQVKKIPVTGGYELVMNQGLTSRQQAPVVYDMNASIYAYDGEYLIRSNSDKLFDGRCTAIMMEDTAVLDIDSEEDYELMEVLMKIFIDKKADLSMLYQNIDTL
ncbi:MAG: acylneuraminate cytidylyltransferase family protein [Methanocorpusculum sp.]|uniref:acylneuraminate cytidylyltransferase family protein n=1 Tax=Methanocorpusculum sp. TaxID=2058474 RepID=UPI002719356D|nr:acylneuraminate cytidylyltransferase family protein [Methanocorpusculum sp.]MDO9523802.1 acylneuraminate cytidylyltransferase family protein [Methanocorpusculum sp.]